MKHRLFMAITLAVATVVPERHRLRYGGVDELGGRDEHTGHAPALEIDDVVHTARRATASIGECLDDQRALGGDLVSQVDGGGLGEGGLLVAHHARSGIGEQLLEPVEEDVAARFADVEQPHHLAVSDGAVSDGAVSDGAVSDGAVSDGAVSDGATPADARVD